MSKVLIPCLNELIHAEAARLGRPWRAADIAPATVPELHAAAQGSSIVVWSGASDATVFGDPSVNHAFRAWHDSLHLSTSIGFDVRDEIALARVQAGLVEAKIGRIGAELVYAEVAGQAEYFLKFGAFPTDQVSFALESLKSKGIKL